MTRHAIAGLLLALVAVPALAEPSVVARPGDAATATTPAAKARCMRHTEVGSNRIKKICMPLEQWNRLTPEERDAVIRSERGAAILQD